MINLQQVTYSHRDLTVFDCLSLEFESGVNYLIEGMNGTGKTTLLNLIAGYVQPTSGKVHYAFINDHLDWDQKYNLRKTNIHFVPTHALHELMHGPELFYQQRYYTIENSPVPTVKDFFGHRYERLANFQFPDSFNIHHLLNLELPRLSNGQFKKIIILKQLLDNLPKVLLLDYPFEGLDPISRTELREFLDHLVIAFNIQLIIADHDHGQLPKTLAKKIVLNNSTAIITDRKENINQNDFSPLPLPIAKKTKPVVEMRNLKIQYGDSIILKNLNWKVNEGERWALTGRNGSGKTTLFSLIYADHPMAYSEPVYLFGKRRGTGESIWDIKKRISYLGPEQLHFLDHATEQCTVREYLEKAQASSISLNQLIEQFQIESILSKKLQQLSNGQLQLTLLLSLFLSQKELLLLDEPFQFLDSLQKNRVNEYLHDHLDPSTTLILITHYEEDVARWTHHRLKL